MTEPKKTFKEYIEDEMGEELMKAFSLDELQKEWEITLTELFFCLASLNKYHLMKHPDLDWHIVLVNKIKANAIKEREKDKKSNHWNSSIF